MATESLLMIALRSDLFNASPFNEQCAYPCHSFNAMALSRSLTNFVHHPTILQSAGRSRQSERDLPYENAFMNR